MVKRRNKALIVFGAILTGFCGLATAAVIYEKIVNGTDFTTDHIFFMVLFIVGVGMLISGLVINSVRTHKNKKLIAKKDLYVATCHTCGEEVSCTIADFRPHRRFPEGYAYCPFCKRPISKNAFTVYPGMAEGANGPSAYWGQ